MKLSQLREQQEIDYEALDRLWEIVDSYDMSHPGDIQRMVEDDIYHYLKRVEGVVPELKRGVELFNQAEEFVVFGVGEFERVVHKLGGNDALKKLARRHKVAQKRQRQE